MSEPSSPSSPLLGQAPKWLRRSSRGVCNSRYVVKMLLLAAVCIILGISISGLYDNSATSAWTDRAGEMRQTGENAPYLQELRKKPYYHEIDLTTDRAFTKGLEGQKSMLQRLRNKIQSLNPWGYRADTLSCSTNQGTNVTDGATAGNDTINEFITTPLDPISPPLLAKITIITGNPSPSYERALRTHNAHNRAHDYSMFVLRQSMMNDVWSKPAYILSCILRELAKPPHERLQWLFWVDADTIIINPYVPLEAFLPPATSDWQDVHLLVTHDWNGLNNGVFPVRVCEWSVGLFASIVAYPQYKPHEHLQFRDQSAMGNLLKKPQFARHTLQVPQRWFNAYQGEIQETIAPYQTRPGDLLVHFAGVTDREERMFWWLERAEQHLPEWEVDFQHTTVKADVANFFEEELVRRRKQFAEVEVFRLDWERERAVLMDYVNNWGFRGLADAQQAHDVNDGISNIDMVVEEAHAGGVKLLEDKLAAEFRFAPVKRLIEAAAAELVLDAESKLSLISDSIFSLGLDVGGPMEAAEPLLKLKESMKRLHVLLASKIMTETQINEYVRNMTDSRTNLERKIRETRGDDNFRFPTEEDTAAEREKLKEDMRKEIEEEAAAAAEAEMQKLEEEEDNAAAAEEKAAHALDGLVSSSSTKNNNLSTGGERAAAARRRRKEAQKAKAEAEAKGEAEAEAEVEAGPEGEADLDIEEVAEVEAEVKAEVDNEPDFNSDNEAEPEPEAEGEPEPSPRMGGMYEYGSPPQLNGGGFLPNMAAVKLDENNADMDDSIDDADDDEDLDAYGEPIAKDAAEDESREQWWDEEGQFSDAALDEVQEAEVNKELEKKVGSFGGDIPRLRDGDE